MSQLETTIMAYFDNRGHDSSTQEKSGKTLAALSRWRNPWSEHVADVSLITHYQMRITKLARRQPRIEKIRDTLHRFVAKKYSEAPVSLLHLFQDALSNKQGDIVKALVYSDRPILKAADSYQTTALQSLCWSFRESNTDVLQTLTDHGMNIDAQDSFGNTPLHKAMVSWRNKYTLRDTPAAVALLLKNGAKKNICNENGVTLIQLALLSGHVEAVELFLTKEEDVQEVDETERTQHNDVEAFEYVLHNYDFDVNATKYGRTLLHHVVEVNMTCSETKPRMIKSLVDRGANPNAKDYDKDTPCLLDCRAYINFKVKYNYTILRPLHCAIHKGHLKIVELLVNRAAALEAKSAEGQTALDYSCKRANLDTVKLLLCRGAKINKSTLHLAIEGYDPAVVKLLLKAGADVNYRRKVKHRKYTRRKTPLQYAIIIQNDSLTTFDIVDILLENDADVNTADSTIMKTPLHLACFSNREDK
ncbi:putative ankyrin repeat protein RF_0381 [Belonocnema kinseyi]|uniref:putative ankyrin repeat protein RF_0381 n=1 Tax=Belonocnema kinseyi TaxID=2817044 RepID=UPI00143DA9DB|nr:putative ankyrin repeat protein RF_0381 [Belonocnema kinseyi]